MANQARLALFILTYKLGNILRRLGLPKAINDWSLPSVQVKLIKIGGWQVRHSDRLVFLVPEVDLPRAPFQGVLEGIVR